MIAHAGTAAAVAELANTTPVYLSQILNQTRDASTMRPRAMGTPMARRLEAAFGKPHGWMDCPHDTFNSELVAQEPAPGYSAWPFRRISKAEWESLSTEQRAVVEGMVHGLLIESQSSRESADDLTPA